MTVEIATHSALRILPLCLRPPLLHGGWAPQPGEPLHPDGPQEPQALPLLLQACFPLMLLCWEVVAQSSPRSPHASSSDCSSSTSNSLLSLHDFTPKHFSHWPLPPCHYHQRCTNSGPTFSCSEFFRSFVTGCPIFNLHRRSFHYFPLDISRDGEAAVPLRQDIPAFEQL